jgi:hypothetical protein
MEHRQRKITMKNSFEHTGILKAGIAKVDITCPTPEPGQKIKDPLYAKALVLDDGNTKLVIVTMDVTAIGGRIISDYMLNDVGEDFLPDLRTRIEKKLNIPGLNVLVNASHTHPPGRLLCDDAEQVSRVYDAIARAVNNLQEVRIGTGATVENRISMNRTLRLKDSSQWSLRHTNPSPWDEEIKGYGPLDPEVGILRIDQLDGSPLAVVYNFACHLLFADPEGSISANFPAYSSRYIENELGNKAMAFFLQGAAGDVIDVDFKTFNCPRNIEKFGRILGETVLREWENIIPGTAEIRHAVATISVPRRIDVPEKVTLLRKEEHELLSSLHGTTLNFKSFMELYLSTQKINQGMDALNKQNINKYLKNIRAMEKLARIQDKIGTLEKHKRINAESGKENIDMEIQAVKIGNCVIISSPAELLTEVGLNIKKASPCKNTFVLGYTNGYVHYGAPANDYEKGGYEVTECLLAPEWQQLFEIKVKELLNKL